MGNLSSPLLSIVVPIHSGLKSIENLQSWISEIPNSSEIEVIAVLDGDNHEAERYLSSQASAGRPILLVQVNCGNPGGARNAGLRESSGEWVTFWDSDDIGYVNGVVSALRQADHAIEVIIGSAELVVAGSIRRILTATRGEMIFNPGIWRFIFRRKSLSGTRFPELRSGEDQVFLARYGFLERKMSFSQEIFYRYFMGAEGQLTRNSENISDSIIAGSLVMEASFLSPNWKTGYSKMSARLLITFLRRGPGSLLLRIRNVMKAIRTFRDPRYLFYFARTLITSRSKSLL